MTLPENWHEMVGLYELHTEGELKGHRSGTQLKPKVDIQGIPLADGQPTNTIHLDKTRFVCSVSGRNTPEIRATLEAIRAELGLPSLAVLDAQRAETNKAARESALKAAAAEIKAQLAPAPKAAPPAAAEDKASK